MDVFVTRSFGKQVAPNEMYRRNREPEAVQYKILKGRSSAGAGSGGATTPCSSYRQMRREGPVLANDPLPGEPLVQALPQGKQRCGPDAHPVDPGGSAPGEGASAGQRGLERDSTPQRVRRRGQAGENVRSGVTDEAKCDVEALRRHPAHPRNGLAKGSQREPEPLAHLSRRPHREEETQPSQATGTATGRSTASTARTDASTSSRVDAQPSEKRTAPTSDVPRIL